MIVNKKAFSLVEIIISITLFSIIMLFLYQTLDMTKKTNTFYDDKFELLDKQNRIKKIFFLDMIHSENKGIPILDREQNAILSFSSTNTYHNPFFTNITYMVSREKNLLRIESKMKFDKEKLSDNFFQNTYIDILYKDVEKFEVVKSDKKTSFYIKKSDNQKVLFSF